MMGQILPFDQLLNLAIPLNMPLTLTHILPQTHKKCFGLHFILVDVLVTCTYSEGNPGLTTT